MNKKGFTLLELLAVIVVLAVIALITIPIVTGIITSAKDSSNARSLEGHISNVNYKIAESAYTSSKELSSFDGTKEEGFLTDPYPAGDKITCASYVIANGVVTKANKCKESGWAKYYCYEEGKQSFVCTEQ